MAEVGTSILFSDLFAEHYDFVWRSARRLGVAIGELDDVVQDTFIIVMNKLNAANPIPVAALRSWIYMIVRNVAANHRRGVAKKNQRSDDTLAADMIAAHAPSPESAYVTNEAVSSVDKWLQELRDEEREAFVLVRLEDFTAEEAASMLGVPANTIASRVRTAKVHLQRRYEQSSESGFLQ